jgi:hypothetical protein
MRFARMAAAALAALGLAAGGSAAAAATPGRSGDQLTLAAFNNASPQPSGNWDPPGPPSPHHWYPPADQHRWHPPAHRWHPPAHRWHPPVHRPPFPPVHPHPGH